MTIQTDKIAAVRTIVLNMNLSLRARGHRSNVSNAGMVGQMRRERYWLMGSSRVHAMIYLQ
jgi:hypothetical protein